MRKIWIYHNTWWQFNLVNLILKEGATSWWWNINSKEKFNSSSFISCFLQYKYIYIFFFDLNDIYLWFNDFSIKMLVQRGFLEIIIWIVISPNLQNVHYHNTIVIVMIMLNVQTQTRQPEIRNSRMVARFGTDLWQIRELGPQVRTFRAA